MVEFEEVCARNFGSFKELQFPIKDQGLVLILGKNKNTSGSNGAGKSLLAEVIFFPIFDNLLRGINPPDIVNITTGKDMLVELSLSHEGKTYKVRNGRKFEGKNKIYEIVDTASETLGLPEDWWLTNVNYGKTVFSGLAVVSGSDVHPLVHGTDKNKKDYLTDLFGLHVYDECLDFVKSNLSRFTKRQTELNALIESKQIEKNSDVKKLLPDDQITEMKEQLTISSELFGELQESLSEELTKLGEVKVEKEYNQKQQKLRDRIDELKTDTVELKDILGDRVNKLDIGKKKVEQLSQKVQDLTAEFKLLRNQREKIMELADTCPTCLQPISEEKKRELLEDLKEKQDNCFAEKIEFDKQFAKGKDLISKIEEYISKRERMRDLEVQLSDVAIPENLEDLREHVDELKREIRSVETEISTLKSTIDQHNIVTTRVSETQSQINKWAHELKTINDDILYWTFLSQTFGQYGMKSVKMDSILETLNIHIAEYIDFLTSSQISAMYRPVEKKATDQFELFVIDSTGERPFKAWSNGEKKRVHIAVLLGIWGAAHELCNSPPNFVYLDDCFGDLDEIGRTRVSELLRSITLDGRTVFVSSPVDQTDIRFDQIWYVEKDGDFSTLRR